MIFIKMNKYLSLVFFLFFIGFGLFQTASAQNAPRLVLHEDENGPAMATITTTGIGEMPKSDEVSYEKKKLFARRTAIVDGYKNLLTAIQGAKKYLTQDGSAVFSVEGYLQNIEVLETRYLKNGMVEVDLMVSVSVYDTAIVNDRHVMGILEGKVSSAIEAIEIIEVDPTQETLKSNEGILQGVAVEGQE